jgi:hypothetical protein
MPENMYASPDKPRQQVSMTATQKAPISETHQVPGVLGQISVKQYETLGGLIQTIYGVFNKARLHAVLQVNPHISDPNTINVGDIILFPAMAAHVQPQPLKRWWVQITVEDNLASVFKFLRQPETGNLSARLIPHWNRLSGLHFSVILGRSFFDEASAVNKLKHLGLGDNAKSWVVSAWDEHSVFYANPYQNTNT